MLASGFAGLGYQIIWTQQGSLWLGHESAAVLAVVAAFFAGLALGGLALGPRIERSARARRWYIGSELVIALWSLLLLFVSAPLGALLERAIGVEPPAGWQWFIAFSGTALMLLPATCAMGATLPAMERLTSQLQREGRSIAVLYANSTLGAVLGVLGVACFLSPVCGLNRSAALCIGLNLLCALVARLLLPSSNVAVAQVSASGSVNRGRRRSVLGQLVVTGLLGIGYEVVVVRVLSQVTENTVYTFALLLAVYLVGTAAGAAAYQRWLESRGDRETLTDVLFVAQAMACLLGAASLWRAEQSKAAVLEAFGPSFSTAIMAEGFLALFGFGLPTFVMGALFSHLTRAAIAAGVSFGRALGVNTVGAALAPVLGGVLALPTLGPKASLLLIVAAYLALTTRPAWATKGVWLPAAATLAVAYFAPPLAFLQIPEGGRLVSYQEGVMAAVSVVEDGDGARRLHINNRQQEGSSVTRHVDARQAWLPLLLHPAPRRALFLGLGTGVTASSAAEDATLEVDAVELLPEVIAASSHFRDRGERESAPRLRVVAADARRYVRASDRTYDVIVSDNFHPARSGSASLYTVEHFEAVKRRLTASGIFCQWLPLHQLDLDTLRSIVRSFIRVNPRGWALLASNSLDTPVLGLVARRDQGLLELVPLQGRLAKVGPALELARLGLEDEYALLGSFVAGPQSLERLAGSAAANTDDHPIVAFRAPRITYAPRSRPRDRLIHLLEELSIDPSKLSTPSPDPLWSRRLAAYWTARDRYIESGRDVHPVANVQQMLAQVREPLLSVLRISPDFRPAYDPLLQMASALARSNVSAARALLIELDGIQPARSEASQLLTLLSDGANAVDAARR